jgi:hypothetical protein
MSTTTTLSPIEQLTRLCSQRTARTDRLHSAVRALTDALEAAGARPGEISATVDGWTLSYVLVRSNVGARDCWSFWPQHAEEVGFDCDGCCAGCCDLGFAVNYDGYLHGDFNCPATGPTREHLIAFGQRAARFVDAILRAASLKVAALDGAIEQIDSAAAKL